MPRLKQPDPKGTDVLVPRADNTPVAWSRNLHRVGDDGTVYVECVFTNWQGVTTHTGIPPGGTWSQFRRLTHQNGPLACHVRELARAAK